jgi:hypothetical protein
MPAAYDMATYLAAQGHGTVGTDIIVGAMPDGADSCVAVYDWGGAAWDKAIGHERPLVQARVRSATYAAGLTKCYDIAKELHKLTNETINTHLYKYVAVIVPPRFETPDRNDRCEFSITFEIIKEVG